MYYVLLKNIRDTNIQEISEVILNTNNLVFIKLFYKEINKTKYNTEKFEYLLIFD